MSVAFTRNSDIEIAYETFGRPGGRPLLLIQGGLAPMEGWHEDFCASLVERGFHVARFDNRDAGRSSRAATRYTLADMATDGSAVLDALGWAGAHVAGVSLGGMIAQTMATRHADRVLSLTSLSSAPDHLMRWERRKISALVKFAAAHRKKPADPHAAGTQMVRVFRIVGSTGYPHDEDWIRDLGRRIHEHRTDLAAFRRQAAAVFASGDRRAELSRVRVPALVITGEADPLQTVRAGRATADAIPGARFVTYPGMGHDLPRELWPAVIDEIHAIATASTGGTRI
ncbi:alpha/beta fold hydrolase [Amycolatopsis sp. lyj-108]|uniref:alpha/beta fold hydrolase n=1 Tax=Amycolatopsis sp. lyj-108 TaxID=2789286 RepID=UPI00397CC425